MNLSRAICLVATLTTRERMAASPPSPGGVESAGGRGAVGGGSGGVVAPTGGGGGAQPGGRDGSAGAAGAGTGTPECSTWTPVTNWQAATGSGTVVSIVAGATAGSQDVGVVVAGGQVAHVVVSLGGLPLPLAVGDLIDVNVARSPGFQFGLTLTITRNGLTALYMSTAEDSLAAPPVPLAIGAALCSTAETCGLLSQNALLAFDGATMVTIGHGQALDVGAFRVFNDGTRLQAEAPRTCADWGGTFFRVAIARRMP